MQEEFNSTSNPAHDKDVLRPLSMPPEDVVCVIRVQGAHSAEIFEPVQGWRRSLRRLFRRSLWRMLAGTGSSHHRDDMLAMDYSAIPQVLATVADLKEQLDKVMRPTLRLTQADADKGCRLSEFKKMTAEVWLGRPDQFQQRRSDPAWYVPMERAELLRLADDQITAENLAAALHPFYTRDTKAWNAMRVEQASEEAVVLKVNIRVGRPIRFGK